MANQNFSKIKAIVFDLDDTLYPQIEYKRSGFKIVASWLADKRGVDSAISLQALEEILSQFGASYPYMFDRLVERLNLESGLVPELVSVFIDHNPQIDCFEGVLPMLDRLRDTYHLGLLTDGRFSVQTKKIAALGLKDRVDKILCSDSMGLEKPAPQLYVWFEEVFHLDGPNLMYVGDNPNKDFHGAHQRQWETIQVGIGEGIEKKVDHKYLAKKTIPSIADLERMMVCSGGIERFIA